MTDIHFGMANDIALVQVRRRGTWEGSLGLMERCLKSFEEGARTLIVDLSECEYVDSTFSGMLVDLAFASREWPGAQIRLCGVRDAVRQTMTELGLVRFFRHVSEEPPAETVPVEPLPVRTKTRLEQAEHVARAHETLMDADPHNVPTFSEIVKALRAEADAERKKSTDE